MSPEVSVIGRTPARVTTSHRVTPSTTPLLGGFVVRNAYRQAANRSPTVGLTTGVVTLPGYGRVVGWSTP
jgi:hypothetical protein